MDGWNGHVTTVGRYTHSRHHPNLSPGWAAGLSPGWATGLSPGWTPGAVKAETNTSSWMSPPGSVGCHGGYLPPPRHRALHLSEVVTPHPPPHHLLIPQLPPHAGELGSPPSHVCSPRSNASSSESVGSASVEHAANMYRRNNGKERIAETIVHLPHWSTA